MPNIRPAKEEELPILARIGAAAFFDEDLFGDVIHPHRHEYPEDMQYYFLKRLRKHFPLPSNHYFVSTVKDANGTQQIAACAQWTRKGKAAQQADDDAQAKLDAEDWKPQATPPNRAADPKDEDVLERNYDYIKHNWTGNREECWDLAWLGTDPQYQGGGHGSALVAWGLEQARAENLAASVIAAYGRDEFYQKRGFTIAGGNAGEGDGNPLRDRVRGGNFWWLDPR